MKDKDQCWNCEEFIPDKRKCKIFLREVDPEKLRTCICFSKVKPRIKVDFEEIINSIDAGRKIK